MGLVEGVRSGIPNPLPDDLNEEGGEFPGRNGRYLRVQGVRKTAQLSTYGQPAKRVQLQGIDEIDVVMLHTFEEQQLDPLTLQNLRNYDNYGIQNLGMQEVARHARNFGQRLANLQIATRQQALVNGNIYYDGNGNLLPSSAGAVTTVPFQRPAGNEGQLDVFGTGAIISASWATSTTNIPLQIRNLMSAALKLTGYPLTRAIYGKNIVTYLTGNDFVSDYLSRNYPFGERYLRNNELPAKLFDLDWIPAYTSFFEDQNGTNQNIVGDDTVVFTPVRTNDWWENIRGSYQVPTSIDVRPDMMSMSGAFKTVYGTFAYSHPTINPPTFNMYQGWTGLPLLKIPSVTFSADCTP